MLVVTFSVFLSKIVSEVPVHRFNLSISTLYGLEASVIPTEVCNIPMRIKLSTTEPYDGIPAIVLKNCAPALPKPLTHIFSISLFYGEVPGISKEALVPPYQKLTTPV